MVYFFEREDNKWIPYEDLPSINNRLSISFYFERGWFSELPCGKSYKFSDLFDEEYDWVTDDGYNNFADWIEDAAEEVGRWKRKI